MTGLNSTLDAIRTGRAPSVVSLRVGGWSRAQWRRANRRLVTPQAADLLVGPTSHVFSDAVGLLHHLLPGVDLGPVLAEYAEVETELRRRRDSDDGAYGDRLFDVQAATARFLYCLARLNKPENVWETGVADGVSSFVLLQAMARNGVGTLHSTDIRSNVGSLVDPNERSQWDLRILDRSHPTRSLKSYAATLGALDLFVHDSLHRYGWQTTELEAAARQLRAGGFIASDDVDSSLAYADFCQALELDPQYLFDETKFFGIARWR